MNGSLKTTWNFVAVAILLAESEKLERATLRST